MFVFFRFVSYLARYGSRAVAWAWAHRSTIIYLLGQLTFEQVAQWIMRHL